MSTETVVLLIATVLVAAGQGLVVITTKPRPRTAIEILWLVLPTVGVIALLIAAWATV